jgi:hypothetical protein
MGVRGALFGIGLAACIAMPSSAVESSSERGTKPINAIWNDTDGFGIWLYGRAGSCSRFHYENPPFIVVGPGGAHPGTDGNVLEAAELPVCMLVASKSQELCSSGTIRWSFDRRANEYRGRYDIRLPGGQRWVGEFRAEHCKWK